MGQFKRGQSGNPGGKRKGTMNYTTRQAKEILNQILFSEIENIREALKDIRTKDKVKYLDCLAKLLPFVLPRQTDLIHPETYYSLEDMSKEELNTEIARLQKECHFDGT
jgi:hypothetical protein